MKTSQRSIKNLQLEFKLKYYQDWSKEDFWGQLQICSCSHLQKQGAALLTVDNIIMEVTLLVVIVLVRVCVTKPLGAE